MRRPRQQDTIARGRRAPLKRAIAEIKAVPRLLVSASRGSSTTFERSCRLRDMVKRMQSRGGMETGMLGSAPGMSEQGRALAAEPEVTAVLRASGWDIDGTSIRWSRRNQSPPCRFAEIGDPPTLPLEDSSFDLVHVVSVLSHMCSSRHQWSRDIRRILRPGGIVFADVLRPTPMAEIQGEPYYVRGSDLGMYIQGSLQNWSGCGPMIFVASTRLKNDWETPVANFPARRSLSSLVQRHPQARGAPARPRGPYPFPTHAAAHLRSSAL